MKQRFAPQFLSNIVSVSEHYANFVKKKMNGPPKEMFAPDKPIDIRQATDFLDYDRHNFFFGSDSNYVSELEWKTMMFLINNLVSK